MQESLRFIVSSLSFKTLLASLLLSTLLTAPAYCQNTCTVILKNGNTVEADSYRVEGGKIFLKYPVGEVAFDLSQIETVTGGGDGDSEPFQDKGTVRAGKEVSMPERLALPAPPIVSLPAPRDITGDTNAAYKDQPFAAQSVQEMTASEDPVVQAEKEQKFQDFFAKYWQSSTEEQAEMSKQMNKAFTDYIGAGTSGQSE